MFIRSFANTFGSVLSALLGYFVPLVLNSHAQFLNVTVGFMLTWLFQHYVAPKITANGVAKGVALAITGQ